MTYKTTFSLLLFLFCSVIVAQHQKKSIDNTALKTLIKKYKKDVRGPYVRLNWYCNDGRINPAKEPCGDGVGGVQRATYKDKVVQLATKEHLFFGQILATTDELEFLDADQNFSRLKQYQLEKYLRAVDNGWINRRAQYYRGAMQSEDEEAWGKSFYLNILQDNQLLKEHFFLLREAAKDIPHSGDSNTAQKMRSESKIIAEEYPAFMKLRIKIHGQPEASDMKEVLTFRELNKSKIPNNLNKNFDALIASMKDYYKPIDISLFKNYTKEINDEDIREHLNNFLANNSNVGTDVLFEAVVEAMWYIRTTITKEESAQGRLAMLDLSLKLEELINTKVNQLNEDNITALIDKICILSTASAAAGYTELWEWDTLENRINVNLGEDISLGQLNAIFLAARNQLEWGTGKNRAVYGDVVELYEGFEPLAHGFLDDRIRGSVMLALGNSIGKLGNVVAEQSSLTNAVLDIKNQSHVHGLNPGYAHGKLEVITGSAEGLTVDPNKIYAFETAPSDLKPVAGILTVSEGNLVSHVQLLARNLGIPNAAISQSNIRELKAFQGTEVFYAVSNQGTVLIKPFEEANATEKKLVKKVIKDEDMITIPIDQIKLDRNSVIDMRELNAKSSGIYCGPKAANLGELKELFPDLVVEGLVIPFGVFLDHMKQQIPNKEMSYWDYLNDIFNTARSMDSNGDSQTKVEAFVLENLNTLRQDILKMELKPSFINDLENSFTKVLGSALGSTPVFLRSDTNMEDLKSFTGAGLNLTLFNVLQKEKILNGIKAVWASPYTERSFKWRQKYLNNPENVYPSILIIPSVNNDCSGVMITKGVSSGKTDEITVAMSKGVGGAVDGQSAETWILRKNREDELLSPARESKYKTLPDSGGTSSELSSFEEPLLNAKKRNSLFELSQILIEKMMAKEIEGPYDVELGFKNDKIWLFQVRPFVENKNAQSSEYLDSISPKVDYSKKISTKISIKP